LEREEVGDEPSPRRPASWAVGVVWSRSDQEFGREGFERGCMWAGVVAEDGLGEAMEPQPVEVDPAEAFISDKGKCLTRFQNPLR
jgi:hypothetical protein